MIQRTLPHRRPPPNTIQRQYNTRANLYQEEEYFNILTSNLSISLLGRTFGLGLRVKGIVGTWSFCVARLVAWGWRRGLRPCFFLVNGRRGSSTLTDKESTSRRNMLYQRKRQLLNEKLREWQKQPQQDSDRAGYHRSIFDRVRFMMPERDRLASNLFEVAPLRSSVGLAVLRDMVAPY
jgi:hypothetical protein